MKFDLTYDGPLLLALVLSSLGFGFGSGCVNYRQQCKQKHPNDGIAQELCISNMRGTASSSNIQVPNSNWIYDTSRNPSSIRSSIPTYR